MAVRNLQFVLSGSDKSASKALGAVGKKADGLSAKFRGFGKAAALGVAGGVAGAAVGLAAFGKSSIAAYKEAEKSAADLAFAFKKFPKLADSNVKSFQELNEQLAKKTVFDDDATASGQAVLAQFGLTGKEILKVTPLLQDYAAKTGKALPDAAADLGKAFQGNAKALKPLGIQYKSTGDKAKDFENVQKLLNDKVGGFAESQGKTAAGQAEILGNKFGELKETVGAQLLPVVTTFVQYLSDKVEPKLQTLADEFAAGEGTGGKLRDALTGLRDIAMDLWPHAQKVAEKVAQFVGFLASHPDVVKFAAVALGLYWVAMKAAATWTGAMAAINLVKLATGIGGVGAASATAAPGIAAAGGAAGFAAAPLLLFAEAITAIVAAYVAYKAVAPAIKDLITGSADGGGSAKFQPMDPSQPGGAANKPGAPPLIPGLVPGRGLPVYKAPAGSANFPSAGDYKRQPISGTRPENRLLVATVDGNRLSSSVASAQQGRASRGLVYASP
jgi:hypothetical protein